MTKKETQSAAASTSAPEAPAPVWGPGGMFNKLHEAIVGAFDEQSAVRGMRESTKEAAEKVNRKVIDALFDGIKGSGQNDASGILSAVGGFLKAYNDEQTQVCDKMFPKVGKERPEGYKAERDRRISWPVSNIKRALAKAHEDERVKAILSAPVVVQHKSGEYIVRFGTTADELAKAKKAAIAGIEAFVKASDGYEPESDEAAGQWLIERRAVLEAMLKVFKASEVDVIRGSITAMFPAPRA